MGVVQVIVRQDNGELQALADYRKGGIVAGYRWHSTKLLDVVSFKRRNDTVFIAVHFIVPPILYAKLSFVCYFILF